MNKLELEQALDKANRRIAELESELALGTISPDTSLTGIIFENTPGGMAIISLEGDILACNKAGSSMLGYTQFDLAGLDTNALYVDLNDKQRMRSLLQTGEPIKNFEIRLNHKDGSEVWVNVHACTVEYAGQPAVMVAFVDISAHKATQAALIAAQQGLEETVRRRTAKLEEVNATLGILNIQLVKKDREREKAQMALKESEERFRALFENNHAVMLTIDPSTGEIVDANLAAANYYGYDLATLKSMRITDINILSLAEIHDAMRKAESEERNHFTFKHRLASGSVRDVEVFSGPMTISGRALLYSIIHDITDRLKTEKQLHNYELIISSSQDLISLVDRNYVYRMVNDAYLKTFNKKREDIIGKSIPELVGQEFFDTVSRINLDKAFAGETITANSTLNFPDKAPVHLSVTYNPVKDSNGFIEYVSLDARNITELKQREESLKNFSDRLALATDAGRIGIWEWDISTGALFWDEMNMLLFDVKPAEFSANYDAWRSRVHPDDLAETEKLLYEALEEKKPFESEFRVIRSDGEIRYFKGAGLLQLNDDGNTVRMIGINQDVTEHRIMEHELRRLATTDPLTGANNRRYFMERTAEEFGRGKRYKTPLSLISLDIDLFKNINDTYGHPVGDEVLKSLVSICRATLRTNDIFARMGGEEFSAALPQTDVAAASLTAERLRQAVEQSSVVTNGNTITYTISLGVAELLDTDLSMADIMRRADDAMYMAKQAGRNKTHVL